jgi:hypothetical protein
VSETRVDIMMTEQKGSSDEPILQLMVLGERMLPIAPVQAF